MRALHARYESQANTARFENHAAILWALRQKGNWRARPRRRAGQFRNSFVVLRERS
jgi:hypothetical protein